MIRRSAIVFSALMLLLLSTRQSIAYEVPVRQINFKPYLNIMFPSNLMEWEDLGNMVDNKMGVGFGLKARTQVSQSWGFVINTLYNDLEVNSDKGLKAASLLTIGFYYSKTFDKNEIIIDGSYGALAAGGRAAGLLMPALEINRAFSERLKLSAELGWLIPNDWLYDFDFKESYSSFTLSLGGTIIF